MHSGKGGGLSDMFGGSVGAAAQGSTVVERNLDRITVTVAIIFAFATRHAGSPAAVTGRGRSPPALAQAGRARAGPGASWLPAVRDGTSGEQHRP